MGWDRQGREGSRGHPAIPSRVWRHAEMLRSARGLVSGRRTLDPRTVRTRLVPQTGHLGRAGLSLTSMRWGLSCATSIEAAE